MVNRVAVALLLLTLAAPASAFALSDPQGPADKQDAPAKAPKAEKAQKPKKQKKAKKPKGDEPPAPDEVVDTESSEGGGGWTFSWKQHPSIRYGSVFRLDGEGKFQEDGRSTYPGAVAFQDWQMHRNRIGVKGHFFKKIEYEVERELTEQELTEKDIAAGVTPKNQWKDVYINLLFVKNAQVQIGRFKVPFGLDELTGVTHNDFIYRSLGANYLDPARDIGLMVHGNLGRKKLFTYAAGGFQHDGDNAKSKKIAGGDQTFVGRATVLPLRAVNTNWFEQFTVGSAFAVSHLSDDSFRPNGLRGRTLLTQDTFFEPVYVKGKRYRWEGDMDWTRGPASARFEYTLVRDNRLEQGLGNQDLPDARYQSWYVTGSWLLTGENKRRPVKPANDFITDGGPGAIEIVARMERLWFDSVGSGTPYRSPRAEFVLPEGEKAFTIGVNWTVNRFGKIQLNGMREAVEDNRNPVLPANFPAGAAFWNVVLRFQLVI